jgi:hypothetical protein
MTFDMTPLHFPIAWRCTAILCTVLLAAGPAPASQPAGGGIGAVLKTSPANSPRDDKPRKTSQTERSRNGEGESRAPAASSATRH